MMSNKTKHTPGPWKATTGPDLRGNVWTESNFRVADCMAQDAALIAAAPDLLNALERLAADYADRVTKSQWDQAAALLFNDVRRAITKARGES